MFVTSAGVIGLGKHVTEFPDGGNFLRGRHSITGRSLVVYNASSGLPITCSSIIRRHVGTTDFMSEISLRAEFRAPIAGTITFTQNVNRKTGETHDTQILVDVFANNLPMPREQKYMWSLTDRKVSNKYK